MNKLTRNIPRHETSNSRIYDNGFNGQWHISDREISLLADVFNGTIYTPRAGTKISKSDLEGMSHEIEDAERFYKLSAKWDVCVPELINKINLMPALAKIELLHHIIEAWRHHPNNFLPFLRSGRFHFNPLANPEVEGEFLLGAQLKSGEMVVDRSRSHVRSGDFHAILDALSCVDSRGRQFIEEEVCFDQAKGFTTCVTTGPSDDIVYAQRKGRNGLSRLVRGRLPVASNSVVVVLKRNSEEKYILITGFVGEKPEPEPFDLNAFSKRTSPDAAHEQSRKFWTTHALIYSETEIVQGTETIIAPAF